VTSTLEWWIVRVFEDAGISGAKGRDKRPGLDAMMKAIARREIDMVAAWSVDRLGRSLVDLLELLRELHAKGVDLFLHQQGLDTSKRGRKGTRSRQSFAVGYRARRILHSVEVHRAPRFVGLGSGWRNWLRRVLQAARVRPFSFFEAAVAFIFRTTASSSGVHGLPFAAIWLLPKLEPPISRFRQ
jgi:hypothetical protein